MCSLKVWAGDGTGMVLLFRGGTQPLTSSLGDQPPDTLLLEQAYSLST